MSFTIDDTQFPLLITVWRGASTVSDIGAYAAAMNRYMARALAEGRSVALVDDATAITATSPEVKKAIAALGPPASVVVGTWVISDSALIRGVVTALRWLNPAMANVRMVASFDRALREARAALDAAG